MPRIFYYTRTAKNFQMTIPFTQYNLRSLSNKFLKFPEVSFSHFTSQVRLVFVEKREYKMFGTKNVMERGMIKCLTFVIRQISSKIFGKITSKGKVQLGNPKSDPTVAYESFLLQSLSHSSNGGFT